MTDGSGYDESVFEAEVVAVAVSSEPDAAVGGSGEGSGRPLLGCFRIVGSLLLVFVLVNLTAVGLGWGVYTWVNQEEAAVIINGMPVGKLEVVVDESPEEESQLLQRAFATGVAIQESDPPELQYLLRRLCQPLASEEMVFDIERFNQACEQRGRSPQLWTDPESDWLLVLQTRFEYFDLVMAEPGKDETWNVCVYAWDEDQICSVVRMWVSPYQGDFRVWDWEDIEYGFRASELAVLYEKWPEAEGLMEELAGVEVTLAELQREGDYDETEWSEVRSRLRRLESNVEGSQSPLDDYLNLGIAYVWTHISSPGEALAAIEKIRSAPGKDVVWSYALRGLDSARLVSEKAQAFNDEIGEMPEVSIDRIEANYSQDYPAASLERLRADAELLGRYLERSPRGEESYYTACFAWFPDLFLERVEASDDPVETFTETWSEYSWLAERKANLAFREWLEEHRGDSVKALRCLAWIEESLSDLESACEHYTECLERLDEVEFIDDEEREYWVESLRAEASTCFVDCERWIAALELSDVPHEAMTTICGRLAQRRAMQVERSAELFDEAVWQAYSELETTDWVRDWMRGEWLWARGDLAGAVEPFESGWKKVLELSDEVDEVEVGEDIAVVDEYQKSRLRDRAIELLVRLGRPAEDIAEFARRDHQAWESVLRQGVSRGQSVDWLKEVLEKMAVLQWTVAAGPEWRAEIAWLEGDIEEATRSLYKAVKLEEEIGSYRVNSHLQRMARLWILQGDLNEALDKLSPASDYSERTGEEFLREQCRWLERYDLLQQLPEDAFAMGDTLSATVARAERHLLNGREDLFRRYLSAGAYRLTSNLDEIGIYEQLKWRQYVVAALVRAQWDDQAKRLVMQLPESYRLPGQIVPWQLAQGEVDADLLADYEAMNYGWLGALSSLGLGGEVDVETIRQATLAVPSQFPSASRGYGIAALYDQPISDDQWESWGELLSRRADDGVAKTVALDDRRPEVLSYRLRVDGRIVIVARGTDHESMVWTGLESDRAAWESSGGWVSIEVLESIMRPEVWDSDWEQRELVLGLLDEMTVSHPPKMLFQPGDRSYAASAETQANLRRELGHAYWGGSYLGWQVDLETPAEREMWRERRAAWDELVADEAGVLDLDTSGQRVMWSDSSWADETLACEVIRIQRTASGYYRVIMSPQRDSHREGWLVSGAYYTAYPEELEWLDESVADESVSDEPADAESQGAESQGAESQGEGGEGTAEGDSAGDDSAGDDSTEA